MNHVVLWTGGMDSTLILLDLYRKLKDSTYNFYVLSFSCNRFGEANKSELEKKCRENIIKKYHLERLKFINVDLNFNSNDFLGRYPGLIQQPIILTLASIFAPEDSVIYAGYHKGDDFFAIAPDLIQSNSGMLKSLGGKRISFDFPLKWLTKGNIYNILKHSKVADDCQYCEFPEGIDGKPCNQCVPCYTLNLAKQEIEYRKKIENRVPDYTSPVFEFDHQVVPLEDWSNNFDSFLDLCKNDAVYKKNIFEDEVCVPESEDKTESEYMTRSEFMKVGEK